MDKISFFIVKTAESIQNGMKPYKIIDNPRKILSGETKLILINQGGKGLQIAENVCKSMADLGDNWALNDPKEWKYYLGIPDENMRYTICPERDNKILLKMVERQSIPESNFKIVEVPVEEWAYEIMVLPGSRQQEYIKCYI